VNVSRETFIIFYIKILFIIDILLYNKINSPAMSTKENSYLIKQTCRNKARVRQVAESRDFAMCASFTYKERKKTLGKAIAIFNQKGGVGKTTTNINLAACLAMKGKKILVLDIDPQGNTTSGIGILKKGLKKTAYEVLIDDSIEPEEAILSTGLKNLDIIPASVQLAGAEIELVQLEARERRLKKAIDKIKGNYDYIFIDCPPSLGLLTINSLTAVDSVLIPIQCEFYALEGVSQLMSTIELVKKNLNKTLEVQGVILSMFDGRTNLSIQVVEEVKKYFRDKVYTTVIPRNVRLAEAPSYGMPITEYDPRSKGALAYMEFAEEFLEQERNGK
jgi:chromosome partitioning protein